MVGNGTILSTRDVGTVIDSNDFFVIERGIPRG
jgi:hypothetical protein